MRLLRCGSVTSLGAVGKVSVRVCMWLCVRMRHNMYVCMYTCMCVCVCVCDVKTQTQTQTDTDTHTSMSGLSGRCGIGFDHQKHLSHAHDPRDEGLLYFLRRRGNEGLV